MKLTRRCALAGLAASVALIAVSALEIQSTEAAAKGQINTIGTPGVAIKGYDPVAYFTERRPRAGKKEFSLRHKNAEWRFFSAANRAAFEADPAKYEPVYGGYCAYGVAQGYLVKIEPEAWSIRNGRLYLNYDDGVQKTWSKNPSGYITKADQRWPKLIGKP
ncbi:MAG TPA: YHS domain-containing (seleno)protein [Hyphomicrobiaceae bacterium]|nr:YHS domain-containing (seleno)protein [Hyphomicrobiaceae bacterium]